MLTLKRPYTVLLHFLIIALVVEVLVLAEQNRKLKQPRTITSEQNLKEGDSFSFQNLEPVREGEYFPSTPHRLVLLMSTTCPFCHDNIPRWNQLITNMDSSVSFVGISLDTKENTVKFVQELFMSFPVFFPSDPQAFRTLNKIEVVPQTILVSDKGKIEKIWTGKLEEEKTKEIVAAISDN